MNAFEIIPVRLGGRRADSSLFLYLTDMGKELQIDYRLWVLKRRDHVILVDTGPPTNEAARRKITDVYDVSGALRDVGVDAAMVDLVVLTHFHWDHAGNAEVFPRATFITQKAEIDFFHNPIREHSCFDRFYSNHTMLENLLQSGRVSELAGDCTLEPGIELLHVGGHTPGSQMVRVRTAEGWIVITGDAIPLNRNYVEGIPSGITSSLIESAEVLKRVQKLQPIALYTGHDPVEVLRLL